MFLCLQIKCVFWSCRRCAFKTLTSCKSSSRGIFPRVKTPLPRGSAQCVINHGAVANKLMLLTEATSSPTRGWSRTLSPWTPPRNWDHYGAPQLQACFCVTAETLLPVSMQALCRWLPTLCSVLWPGRTNNPLETAPKPYICISVTTRDKSERNSCSLCNIHFWYINHYNSDYVLLELYKIFKKHTHTQKPHLINPLLLFLGEELKTNFYGSGASREGKHLTRYWIYHFGSISIWSCHSLHSSHWFIQLKMRVESPIHKCDHSFLSRCAWLSWGWNWYMSVARKKSMTLTFSIQLPYLLTIQYILL